MSTISTLSNTTLTDQTDKHNGHIDEEIEDIYRQVTANVITIRESLTNCFKHNINSVLK